MIPLSMDISSELYADSVKHQVQAAAQCGVLGSLTLMCAKEDKIQAMIMCTEGVGNLLPIAGTLKETLNCDSITAFITLRAKGFKELRAEELKDNKEELMKLAKELVNDEEKMKNAIEYQAVLATEYKEGQEQKYRIWRLNVADNKAATLDEVRERAEDEPDWNECGKQVFAPIAEGMKAHFCAETEGFQERVLDKHETEDMTKDKILFRLGDVGINTIREHDIIVVDFRTRPKGLDYTFEIEDASLDNFIPAGMKESINNILVLCDKGSPGPALAAVSSLLEKYDFDIRVFSSTATAAAAVITSKGLGVTADYQMLAKALVRRWLNS